MIAMPAVDLREGACVQLVGGSFDEERVRLPDPVAQAEAFRAAGFGQLHVVDLDAATGRGDNAEVIDALLRVGGLSVTVGGGVRTVERALALTQRGAARVVVGTRAVEEPAFLAEVAAALPGQVVLSLDVRGREVLTRGWAAGSGRSIDALLQGISGLDLAGVLVTAVHVEGTLSGVDADLYRDVVSASSAKIIASGGVGRVEDLRVLAGLGCAAAVIGMALYTGALDAALVAREFSR
ncbi:MAG: 1-(5-phosphoribosyl)-5-[(5-phosphoribosylamino)methylideneamino] imidazole-4-carboxamide isomerase [Polyangiaceae bacterium]|nr:1-(5-phosphoribosyl)-5-[(5-phosphoribosylamino)methylideneamino] imidazole-4-carboxamide isomerase [Polyangiaceae bacterium]MBK8941895.1 1-(5-phosphoribosyl)-5-[(5-phosphoribosylamino)methylideneamino] imidazole-4-carboxamide isomerase [Polyangiaceae bacterium]